MNRQEYNKLKREHETRIVECDRLVAELDKKLALELARPEVNEAEADRIEAAILSHKKNRGRSESALKGLEAALKDVETQEARDRLAVLRAQHGKILKEFREQLPAAEDLRQRFLEVLRFVSGANEQDENLLLEADYLCTLLEEPFEWDPVYPTRDIVDRVHNLQQDINNRQGTYWRNGGAVPGLVFVPLKQALIERRQAGQAAQ